MGDAPVLHQHLGQVEDVQDAARPATPRRPEGDPAQAQDGAVTGPLQAADAAMRGWPGATHRSTARHSSESTATTTTARTAVTPRVRARLTRIALTAPLLLTPSPISTPTSAASSEP